MYLTYRGLGFDPTPGEPGSVAQAITQFVEAADTLAGVEPALRRAERRCLDWHGDAADAFRSRLRDAPSGLDSRERTLRLAAEVLGRWAETLSANKRRTEELDETAVKLRKRIEAARDDLQDKQNAMDLAATSAASAGAAIELNTVSTLVAELEAKLAEVLDRARKLARDHQRVADAVADELAELGGGSPRPVRPGRPDVPAVGVLLLKASRTSTALAGLLTPPAATTAVPAGAVNAFAAALAGNPSR